MKYTSLSEIHNRIQSFPPPQKTTLDSNRALAMLTGIAIGDALGAPTEGMEPNERWFRYQTVATYYAGRSGIQATDDSQMAFLTLDSINSVGGIDPDDIAKRFTKANLRGTGNTVPQALSVYASSYDWRTCGINSLGNGALMRIAPVIVPYIKKGGMSNLWHDVADITSLTHRGMAAVASSVAYIDMLLGFLERGNQKFDAVGVLDRFCNVVATLQDGDETLKSRSPHLRSGDLLSYCRLAQMALDKKTDVRTACDRWYSGAYLPEILPTMLYIVARYWDDPEHAIISAVNDTKDSDTVASLVAAAMGALHGGDAFYGDWIIGLTGDLHNVGDYLMWDILHETKFKWL